MFTADQTSIYRFLQENPGFIKTLLEDKSIIRNIELSWGLLGRQYIESISNIEALKKILADPENQFTINLVNYIEDSFRAGDSINVDSSQALRSSDDSSDDLDSEESEPVVSSSSRSTSPVSFFYKGEKADQVNAAKATLTYEEETASPK